ncbi:MAG: hypothetical protein QM655_05580 [Nocardioidaceae bacterium]
MLLLATGAAWEAHAVEALDGPRVNLVQRCLDLADLLAAARQGTASAAVVDAATPGLDVEVVGELEGAGLVVVAVTADADAAARAQRLGVHRVLAPTALGTIADVATEIDSSRTAGERDSIDDELEQLLTPSPDRAGRQVVVWGPAGAPGRTTVAVALASQLAEDSEVMLIDADPYGGAVAQYLGVLDQASGLLASARYANGGQLDDVALAGFAPRAGKRLRVLTGLPRADRWPEVRERALDDLLSQARRLVDTVVVDVGFCLEAPADPYGSTMGRNAMTIGALRAADQVVAVGGVDPISLARLVRGLRDLGDVARGVPVVVVLNRARPSMAWREEDVVRALATVAPGSPVHVLPDDPAAADRALMAGSSITETADGPLRKAIAELTDTVRVLPGRHTEPRS